jgi:tetratricopeptide (TPR) repeat protein
MAADWAMIEAAQRARQEYSSSGDMGVLAESVRLGWAALSQLSGAGALEGSAANDLAASLGMLYEATGDVRLLDEQLALLDRALELLPSGDVNLAAVYTNITGSQLRRFARSGNPDDVTAAVAAARQSITASPPGSRDLTIQYGNLAGALRTLHDLTGDPSALDESINAGRTAAASIQPSTYGQAMILASLAGSLHQRGNWKSSLADIEESIAIARRAVAAAPPSSPWHRTAGTVLAGALRTKAERTGDLTSLSEATVLQRQNADLVPKGQAERGIDLVNLAATLLVRYEWQKDWADLVAAEDAARQALESANAVTAAEIWSVRVNCWRHRADKLAADGDRPGAEHAANEAVEAAKKSVGLGGGARERSGHLLVACNALATRYELTGTQAHRSQAIAAYRQAVESPDTSTEHGQLAMLNLGTLLLHPEESRPAPQSDVAAAMSLFRHVLAEAEPGGQHWGLASFLLIGALARLREVAGEAVDLHELDLMYRQVTQARAVTPERRGIAGMVAGVVLMQAGQTAAAAQIFTEVVRQLPAVAWRGAARRSRESALAEFTEVGSHAAACHLAAGGGDPEAAASAVEVLEQGRGVLWADMLELRRGEAELWDAQPELAARLRGLARVLDTPDDILQSDLADSRAVDQRMAAAAMWKSTVAEIRERSPDFLRPAQLADLIPATTRGPVVVVNMSDLRCDALIVTSAGVSCIPLPLLTAPDIRQHTTRYLQAYGRLTHGQDGDAVGGTGSPDPDQVHSEVLEWLWDAVAEPVLAALDIRGAPAPGQAWPRIWWCPTGLLTLLPLHAAGYHAAPPGPDVPPRTVLDRVISSYTPTLGALADATRADAGADVGADDGTLLFVGVPESPGMPRLPGASDDRDLLFHRLGPRLHVLFAEDATVEAVRDALTSHRWAHFSCHGQQDLMAPSKGGLALSDGTLTVTGLSAQGHAGEFAFLAACQTATGGAALPDETISLATAIHYAGYRHVVATLWSAYDFALAEVTRMVYDDLAASGCLSPARSAEALHSAVRRLRDTDRERSSWWAPFIHIGP